MNLGIAFLIVFFMYVLSMVGVYLVNHQDKNLIDVLKAPFKQ